MQHIEIPIIVVCCYIVGEVYKMIFKEKQHLYKFIPIITSIFGGIIGTLIFITNPEIMKDITNIWDAMLIGIISGSCSTGANQIVKQIFKDESVIDK